jgi:hypothetical protein
MWKGRGITPLGIKAESLAQGYEGPNSPSGQNVFSASLPLVFRPWRGKDFIIKAGQKRHLSDILKKESQAGYIGFITAQDRSGNAAFLGLGTQKDTLLLSRDDEQSRQASLECRFSVENRIPGGITARRSE